MPASAPSVSACRPTRPATDIPEFGVEFGFEDKLAPRVGFAYDLKGDGRSKVFGSWGVFYDIFKLELPRGSFGGDKWLEYYYTLDTLRLDQRWSAVANCPPACPGTLIEVDRLGTNPIDFRHVSFGSDAHRSGPQADEAAGSDRRSRASAERRGRAQRPLRPQADRPRDRRHRTASSTRAATRSTSSRTRARVSPQLAFTIRHTSRIPKPVRDYDSVEFAAREAVRRQLVSPDAATCGAGCTATTQVSRSRTRTGAPARTSAVCGTTR